MNKAKLLFRFSIVGFAVCALLLGYNLLRWENTGTQEAQLRLQLAQAQANRQQAIDGIEALEWKAKQTLDRIRNLRPGDMVVLSSQDTDRYWETRRELFSAAEEAKEEAEKLISEIDVAHKSRQQFQFRHWVFAALMLAMLFGAFLGQWRLRRDVQRAG